MTNIKELAKRLYEVDDILDPYGDKATADEIEECLRTWKPGEIKEGILDYLSGCIDDGIVKGEDAEKVKEVIADVGHYIYKMKSTEAE